MKKEKKKRKDRGYLSIITILVLDIFLIIIAGGLALLTRFEFSASQIPANYFNEWVRQLPIQIPVILVVFAFLRMYRFVWRTVSLRDMEKMMLTSLLAVFLAELATKPFGIHLPKSVWFLMLIYCTLFLVGIRCAGRLLTETQGVIHRRVRKDKKTGNRILLVGAGAAGRMLAKELRSGERPQGEICCIVDDNPALWGKYVEGVRIIGGREKITAAVEEKQITDILFAIPSADAQTQREILSLCKGTGCRVKKLPGIYQLVSGEVTLADVKEVQIEDLLGREPVRLDLEALTDFLGGKMVLVTGGGGSIGSELCRQIARYHPKCLVILDIYENNAYDIQQELRQKYGSDLELRVEIASVRDEDKMNLLFSRYRPDVVFHAAAHKHVPLMENCPEEAVKNNVLGTYHVMKAAEQFGVKKFVMISTDKAVNPTNFMGATKRFCEMMLQSRIGGNTQFCAVRFGNVLGSNGSVVPLFKRQIQEGGPVTLTDKRIIRYFMTIPEASQLVLEAGAMAKPGQIFVLDMGAPVKILELAENLIRLSGKEPYTEIEIREIGLRPGEKLYEELLMDREGLEDTPNKRIFVEQQGKIPPEEIRHALDCLEKALREELPAGEMIRLLRQLVPTYRDPDTVNREAVQKLATMKGESA